MYTKINLKDEDIQIAGYTPCDSGLLKKQEAYMPDFFQELKKRQEEVFNSEKRHVECSKACTVVGSPTGKTVGETVDVRTAIEKIGENCTVSVIPVERNDVKNDIIESWYIVKINFTKFTKEYEQDFWQDGTPITEAIKVEDTI